MSLLRAKLEEKLLPISTKQARNLQMFKSEAKEFPSQMSSKEQVMVATLRMEKSNQIDLDTPSLAT